MIVIKQGDRGAAIEDIQQRLVLIGFLDTQQVTMSFDDATSRALERFCGENNLEYDGEVDSKIWAALVDATYHMGDRTLYLRMPYLHGHDVLELQQALGALGFFCGSEDAIFGAHTELALRKFQMNLGLPSDGIAGAYTYAALRNLEHSWSGKGALHGSRPLGFARAADVLEENALCLFGTCDFTRSVASRMSNLALATNPASKIVSADALSVEPGKDMLLVQVAMEISDGDNMPIVLYSDDDKMANRLSGAIHVARKAHPPRVKVVLPGKSWMEAGEARTAQHFAITLLDALCAAL